MTEFVNVTDLGKRKVSRIVTEAHTDQDSGMKHMRQISREFEEIQPVLTADEAKVLKGADWRSTPEHLIEKGPWMCIAGGRRFFAPVNPNQDADDESEENDFGTEEDMDRPATMEMSKAELVELAKGAVTKVFSKKNDKSRAYFSQYELGSVDLERNTKEQLIAIIDHFREKAAAVDGE